MTKTQAESNYLRRQAQLAGALLTTGLDALALNAGPSLTYLTGLQFHLSERPAVALFAPNHPPSFIVPELETGKLSALSYPFQVFPYREDPGEWAADFRAAADAAGLDGRQVGVEPQRLRVLELRLLEAAAPRANFVSAEAPLASLRIHKDETEIAAMRKAVAVAQAALLATLPVIQVGMTERQLAAELSLQLLRHGSDPELPFSPIVASGPNSANPHAFPTDRSLSPGDILILDWGASVGGYFSDLTRTFSLGEPDTELVRAGQVVAQANTAARALAAPGVTAEQVDHAARSAIERAGFGEYFIHRTGHGLGLEGHEEPYIRAGNPLPLAPGMTFTIEPGIYLPGRGGVRIEDDIVITPNGSECLSDLPRDLIL